MCYNNIQELINRLELKNNKIRKQALDIILDLTLNQVDWIYDYWDIFVKKLNSNNSYQRTIGMLVISNLALSDKEDRIVEHIDKYLAMMEDEKFITSRQTIQSSYKIALIKPAVREFVIEYLLKMFTNNIHLKSHANLVRRDIINSLCKIYKVNAEGIDLNHLSMKIEEYCDPKEKKEFIKLIDSVR